MLEKRAKDIAKERWNTEFLQRANDEMVYLQMAVKKRFFNQQDMRLTKCFGDVPQKKTR